VARTKCQQLKAFHPYEQAGQTRSLSSTGDPLGFIGGAHTWPGHADLLTEAGAETVIRRLGDLPKVAEAMMSWEGMSE
jgi:hypothetical protein